MKVNFQKFYKTHMTKIYSEWLPETEYKLANVPMFSFTKFNDSDSDNAYSEIWVAVNN